MGLQRAGHDWATFIVPENDGYYISLYSFWQMPRIAASALGEFLLGKTKTNLFELVIWEVTEQAKINHIFFCKWALFCSIWYWYIYKGCWLLSSKTLNNWGLWSRNRAGWNYATRLSFFPRFSWLLLWKYYSACHKLLVIFSCSKKVESDSFSQIFHWLYGRMYMGISLSFF